ncbi:uncharacterized metal-dependent hydrolase YabD [Impatiens glandulifera]|uniref:uncharacterized metal-dependent hydrolase YabD n=1 Tax=Impatiens glandulifera TaxID=253017 RepID=UPI001FB1534B|nr:uncharacterized metal-dependent hydrolase YabD [Impatiens glandulifera]XP_047327289.1 uncharacterized metal-dependent hydrolase YabD [Impatiens glandulifera]XP_047327290.1 uncharacterized metal-dependent hydrolase YabD [Impatiens glandulifera]
MMKLFDAHCHLQDPMILTKAPQLIRTALDNGVLHFAVNGTCENDWHLVKQLSDNNPSIIPCFGIHPWFILDRTPNWMNTLKEFLDRNPCAAIGEIGIDKGSQGKKIDFSQQIEVCTKQLELAKELKKPASIHCVRAFNDLLQIMKSVGPFPNGVILHSYLGSAEMVPMFAELGGYFSFSGFLMSLKESKARRIVKSVPAERLLLETDAPDALPKMSDKSFPLFMVETDHVGDNETLNHPANIVTVLDYVASLLDMSREEIADLSYRNAVRLFSYEGSKVLLEQGNTC